LSITLTDAQPQETGHSRYAVIFTDQSPAFVNVDGLVDLSTDENIAAIVMVASDGTSAPVTIDKEDDGIWYIRLQGQDDILETVQYGDDDEQLGRDLFVPGFADEAVPYFTVESMRGR